MSQNNSMVGFTDIIDLSIYPQKCYFFELSHLPIFKSLVLYFDEFNNITRLNSIFNGYDRSDFIEYKIIKITDDISQFHSDDDYKCIHYNSEEAEKYAECLIGTKTFSKINTSNIITITKNHTQPEDTCYTEYKDLLKDKIFIDFSESEKIKSILDEKCVGSIDRVCTQFVATYFYDV